MVIFFLVVFFFREKENVISWERESKMAIDPVENKIEKEMIRFRPDRTHTASLLFLPECCFQEIFSKLNTMSFVVTSNTSHQPCLPPPLSWTMTWISIRRCYFVVFFPLQHKQDLGNSNNVGEESRKPVWETYTIPVLLAPYSLCVDKRFSQPPARRITSCRRGPSRKKERKKK